MWFLVAVVLCLAPLLAGCGRTGESGSATGPAAGSEVTPVASDGWIVLFDGTSTDAWRAYGGDAFPSTSWAVVDGALATVPGTGVDLISRESFTDFELEFAWRVTPAGNGGVMIRVAESDEPSWTTGPEYQVLDDALHPDGGRPETSAGALYDLIAPSADKVLAPVGEFNEARIVVRDGHVEHWLGGVEILAYDWASDATRALIEASKFRDFPGFMAGDEGHVVLQHHGEAVAYRDVRIRRLGP